MRGRYTNLRVKTITRRAAVGIAALGMGACGGTAWAQTQVFLDDFQRATLNGAGAPTTYTVPTTLIGDGGSSLVPNFAGAGAGNTLLQITNDATAAPNTTGGAYYISGSTSSYASAYKSTLSQNTGLIEWTINGKQIRDDPAGFVNNGGGSYGWAVSLAGSDPNLRVGMGYGIIFGNAGTNDSPRLVRYSSGLGVSSDIIGPTSTDTPSPTTDFFSVRVTYDPSNSSWSLYLRDDNTTLQDAGSGVNTPVGTGVVDTTYTGTALGSFGYAWSYSTGPDQTAQFDNYRVRVTGADTPEPGTLLLLAFGAGPATGVLTLRRRAVRRNKV